jgi:hypothetical protein
VLDRSEGFYLRVPRWIQRATNENQKKVRARSRLFAAASPSWEVSNLRNNEGQRGIEEEVV